MKVCASCYSKYFSHGGYFNAPGYKCEICNNHDAEYAVDESILQEGVCSIATVECGGHEIPVFAKEKDAMLLAPESLNAESSLADKSISVSRMDVFGR